MKEPIVKCEHLNKHFGKKQILKDVSFNMYPGDILGFIGPNGAGKTTTIKLILGLQSIDSGHVSINGYDIKKDFEKAISQVGAIVESPDLYMNLTGYQNLKLIANYYKNITDENLMKIVKVVGLEKRINDKVSKYSLGMRQRLGIAQALINSPSVLILDEPTNGLDPEGIKELRTLLVQLAHEYQMAIFISSHNLSELESFCTKVVIIRAGSIIETTDIKSLKQKHDLPTYELQLSTTKGLDKILSAYNFEVKKDNIIQLDATKNDIKNIIRMLVEGGIDIYYCKQVEMTLEEAFLRKTGGNVIE
jgi:ABC-2 type transport system ATP-binding protein